MTRIQKYLSVTALGFSAGAIYMIPFIKFIFYDSLINVLHVNNEQLGFLMTLYALGCTILFIPGGWMADKFSIRKTVAISSFATGILCFLFAFSLNYKMAILLWILLPFTTSFAFFSAGLKGVRLIGGEKEQGKFNGLFQGITGVVMAILALVAFQVFSIFTLESSGLRATVIFYGISNIIAALSVWFYYYEDVNVAHTGSDSDNIKLADMMSVIKLPEIWCIGFIIFAGYGLYVAQSYFTPYLTGVLGMSLKIALILSILRTYFLRFIGAPLGGIIADKTQSAAKILMLAFALLICFILYFTFYAKGINIFCIIILIVIITLISFGIYGVMWATVEEAKIPKFLTGTAIGFIGIVGYLPDLFIHTMFGAWLDKYGTDGYQKIFLFLVVLAAMGILGSYGVLRIKKKRAVKN